MPWYEQPTRYLFFTGKGGTGKTTLSCTDGGRTGRPGQACAAGQHGPGVQSRSRVRGRDRRAQTDCGHGRSQPGRPEHKSASRRSGLSGPNRRAGGTLPADVVRRTWRRNYPGPARRKSPRLTSSRRCSPTARDGRLRPHRLRHRPHRSHPTTAPPARRVDGLPRLRARAARRVSDRSPGLKKQREQYKAAVKRSPTVRAPPSFWSAGRSRRR